MTVHEPQVISDQISAGLWAALHAELTYQGQSNWPVKDKSIKSLMLTWFWQ